jgi:hypothetical protein
MQFLWFLISWTSDSKKTKEDIGLGFFWSDHQIGPVFKSMLGSVNILIVNPCRITTEHNVRQSDNEKKHIVKPTVQCIL